MDEITKLKRKRTVCRANITKYVNKFETETELDRNSLLENLNYLNSMGKQVKEFDNKIQDIIVDEQEFDLEIKTSFDYNEKIVMWSSRISALMQSLNLNSDPQLSNFANRQTQNFVDPNALQNILPNSPGNSVSTGSSNSYKTVRLPKLSIEKYYGDPCLWLEFWNQFQNSIDKNDVLTRIDKFSYLKSLLGGVAANSVNGFDLSDENYESAKTLLKERFGREELVINAHMSKLLNLYPVRDASNIFGLRKLYDICVIQIRSLESLNVTSGMYGHLLQPILMKLIPADLALEFNRKRLSQKEQEFDVMELLRFLKVEIECRESYTFQNQKSERKNPSRVDYRPQQRVGGENANYRNRQTNPARVSNSNNHLSAHEYLTPVTESSCLYCKGSHKSEMCENLSILEKKDILKKQARCFLCLGSQHRIKVCKKKEMCDICNRRHNRSICFQLENKSKDTEENVVSVSHCSNKSNNEIQIETNREVLLQTCTVVVGSDQEENVIRLLLDNGSMRSFVTSEISRKLRLPVVRKETLSVYAFGSKKASERVYNVVKIRIKNRLEPSLNIEIEALETDEISAANIRVPNLNIAKTSKQLKGLQLADCYEYKENKVVILIGADFYYDVVTGRIKRLNEKLVATETIFGWCLQGVIGGSRELLNMEVVVEERVLSDQLKQFWELENLGVEAEDPVSKTDVDEQIMKNFESGISFQNNRYKVKFPWKPEMKQQLYNNREVATRRFLRLRNSFQNDPTLFSGYQDVIEDYIKENIIEPVSDEKEDKNRVDHYLPHRAVIRNDKTTSKLRVVFDASSHSKGHASLNDCLYTGLNLMPDLFLLLVKFRSFRIAFTADIKQAFLQIEIDEEDRDAARFLWDDKADSVESNLQIYRMTRVLFGVSSSPFLLAATIKHHLKKYVETFPYTSRLLDSSLYVDDVVSGANDIDEALRTCLESFDIFQDASMILRKFQTNSVELREKLKELGLNVVQTIQPDKQALIPFKVLGVAWNTENDIFFFDTKNLVDFVAKRIHTKRFLLQAAGRIFDPVGFLGPFVIRIKCLIQEIWCLGLDWDEALPKNLSTIWEEWCEEVAQLNNISVPRYYFADALPCEVNCMQLHFFSDASKIAYGCVAYLRAELNNGKVITSFVSSKSRVAPLKILSVPRLELMGALLSSRLNNKISKSLDYKMTRYFWTDSSIVYFWMKGKPERFKPFVKNRVMEMQKNSNPSEWFHCPGKENPADLISRGLTVIELQKSNLWWNGPPWLGQSVEKWPRVLKFTNELDAKDLESFELRKGAVVNTVVNECKSQDSLVQRYSSFSKLIRISAWCLRFINNCRLKPEGRSQGYLNAIELNNATKAIVKIVQLSEFHAEIKSLMSKRLLPQNSGILSLNVFLDKDGLLRVGGRLTFSNLSEFQKHQLLLPKTHHFTELLIDYYHKRALHSGTQTTLSLIRQLYWIPSGQDRVRRVINRCLTCFRSRNRTINQMMGDLPKDRVVPSRPFDRVGIDFAGPIITKPNLKRSKVTLKSYIAIFICFCTKATHFEIVSDLTTEAFLACLRRFIARRSKPSSIWSDNATNFKGAKNVLDSFFRMSNSDAVQRFSAEESINWNFIPPASPHFGGLWEANIKSMKRILLKVTKSTILNFEELSTLVTQIEAILNSRPLSPLSADPMDLQPLTPGHFLVGSSILAIPEPNTALDPLSFTSRWSQIQNLRAKFWDRWTMEYLNELQTRKKWQLPQPNVKEGQLVLLKEPHKTPLEWKLARVVKIITGPDQLVRVVEVRSSSGLFKRNISKIVPLPLPDDVGQQSNGGRDVPASENQTNNRRGASMYAHAQ